ncbi:hypothetical protein NDU88_001378 [Pleurodeles waltl]|uniref:Uncharacterized protein n=1 Tax=Pleurodeles waltl TaxID=8319 RepID=A0AAV7WLK9_PLEWA|nr:hypothetical protein NDU88_001378 [Pleurodeles waltl]
MVASVGTDTESLPHQVLLLPHPSGRQLATQHADITDPNGKHEDEKVRKIPVCVCCVGEDFGSVGSLKKFFESDKCEFETVDLVITLYNTLTPLHSFTS